LGPAPLSGIARLRAELMAEGDAQQGRAMEANAEIDRRKRQAERERAEAGRRQRASVYSGSVVSAPGEPQPDWVDMPSEEDE
jgi:hypothetical protein